MMQNFIKFFEADVLSLYSSNPHKYIIDTDYFEGELKNSSDYFDELNVSGRLDECIRIRFGYHAKSDGDLCLAVFIPDLANAPNSEKKKWTPFIVDNDTLAESDDRFTMWFDKNIQGSWSVKNGPRKRLATTIEKINACCISLTDKPLYSKVINNSVVYPNCQNTHAYEDAHKNLYGFLIDSLSKECLISLAANRQKKIPDAANMNPPTLLRHVFNEFGKDSRLHKLLSLVSTKRGDGSHGVRNSAKSYDAFHQFHHDLEEAVESFGLLLSLIEKEFSVCAAYESSRLEAMSYLPKIIIGGIESNYSICKATQMTGKTVEKVWFGLREENEHLHQSEALFIQFTNGEILAIDTGSNVVNILDQVPIKPTEFHVDLNLTWVPAPSND